MGQRTQIFIKMVNPLNHLSFATPKEKEEATKEFGTGKFAILSYHNQWLFGRSALTSALSLLKFGSQFTKEEKTSDKVYGADQCPFAPNGMKRKTKNQLTDAMAFIMNFRAVDTEWLKAGVGRTFYIGDTDGTNHDFTLGDNNDGIHIVDLIESLPVFIVIAMTIRNSP